MRKPILISYGVEPREKVLDWVFDLSQTRVMGTNQQNANALGIEPFDDVDLAIFEHILDGKSPTGTTETIRREYPAKKLDQVEGDLSERVLKITSAVILGPLFR